MSVGVQFHRTTLHNRLMVVSCSGGVTPSLLWCTAVRATAQFTFTGVGAGRGILGITVCSALLVIFHSASAPVDKSLL